MLRAFRNDGVVGEDGEIQDENMYEDDEWE